MHDEDEFDAEVWDASEKMWLVAVVSIVAIWAVVVAILAVVVAK